MPCGSTSTNCLGNTTVVEPNSSTTAGPLIFAPGGNVARSYSGEDAAKFVNGVLDGAYRRLKEEGLVAE